MVLKESAALCTRADDAKHDQLFRDTDHSDLAKFRSCYGEGLLSVSGQCRILLRARSLKWFRLEVNKLRIVSPGKTTLVAEFSKTTEDAFFNNFNRFLDGPTITMISKKLTDRQNYG